MLVLSSELHGDGNVSPSPPRKVHWNPILARPRMFFLPTDPISACTRNIISYPTHPRTQLSSPRFKMRPHHSSFTAIVNSPIPVVKTKIDFPLPRWNGKIL